jgi:hypothetical protein
MGTTEEKWELYFLKRSELQTQGEETKKERGGRHQSLFESFGNRRIYERKGYLFFKELGDEKFSQRTFVLIGDFLYFMKDDRNKEDLSIISLANASVKPVKDEKRYCFEVNS